MIPSRDVLPMVQEIVFRNLEIWKDPITELRIGKMSKSEFKQFVVTQFSRIEDDITGLICHLTENERITRQMFDDNLKTKALLNVLIAHPELLEPLSKQQIKNHETSPASSELICAAEVEES